MLPEFTATDHAHMARALQLAERGLGTTQPNPRVGCVVAQGEAVVGAGWHERAGEPHAEVFALRAAGERARGATAYVTLEPCSHFGRTPPCADALIAAGIGRVVAAAEDPNPHVNGGGFGKLRAAGIAVATGLLRDAARELNCGFFSRMERQRPWVRVKLAMSLDGRTALADGSSKWITGAAARADVQRWRARSSAILTGVGTVRADDPRLTVRVSEREARSDEDAFAGLSGRRRSNSRSPDAVRGEGSSTCSRFKPLRVVLDPTLKTPPGALLLNDDAPTLIVHAPAATPRDDRFTCAELAAVECEPSGRIDLLLLMQLLAGRKINELQVEAGPTLSGALFAAGLVDELLLYVAPVLLGDSARPLLALPALGSIAGAQRLRLADLRMVGADQRLLFRCDRP